MALVNVTDPKTGAPLVKGKKVTGFTNTEEEQVGLTKKVASSLCPLLHRGGANVGRWRATRGVQCTVPDVSRNVSFACQVLRAKLVSLKLIPVPWLQNVILPGGVGSPGGSAI